HSEIQRKLLFPSEVMNLSSRQAIVFLPGKCRPLRTTMLRYFEDPAFAGGDAHSPNPAKIVRLSLLVLLASLFFFYGVILHVNEQQKRPVHQPALPMPDTSGPPERSPPPYPRPYAPAPPYVVPDQRRQKASPPPAPYIITPRKDRKEQDHE